MISSKILFILIPIVYFISDFFFDETMLYIMGGAILGSLHEFNKGITMLSSLFIWIAILVSFITLFYRLRNRPLKFFLLVIIATLLYVADFILYEFLPYDIINESTRHLTIALKIIIKSLLLFMVIYFESRQRLIVMPRSKS